MNKIYLIFLLPLVGTTGIAQIYTEGTHIENQFPSTAAFGDFDNDGHIDFVQGVSVGDNQIYLNNGDTTFTLGSSFPSENTSDIAAVDIDNDGDLDIIRANSDTGFNKVYLNDGAANFTEGSFLTGLDTSVIAVGDFNEDGFPDIILGSRQIGEVERLFINQGDGTFLFDNSIPWTTGSETSDIYIADINNDNHLDIVISKRDAPLDSRQENEIWFGAGDGTFIKSTQIFPLIPSGSIGVGDYNGDGIVDVVFAEGGGNFGFNAVKGYLNDGSNVFNSSTSLFSDSDPDITDIAFIDVDVDQDLDLVISREFVSFGNMSEVILNDGSGNFNAGGEQFSSAFTRDIEVVDIDQDNDLDLFFTNVNGEDSVFWINQTDPPLSVTENEVSKISIYPNPVAELLNVSLSKDQNFEFTVIDIQGRVVIADKIDRKEKQINISQLTQGLYLIIIETTDNTIFRSKFLKK